MIVYHGTDSLSAENIIKEGIDVTYGEESVDNGKGFYTTPSYEFALRRAEKAALRRAEFYGESVQPTVLEIEIEIPQDNEISVKEFVGCTYEWKEFIFFNRVGLNFIKKWELETNNHNLDCKYDIVIDETADSGITSMVSYIRYARNIQRLKEEILKIEKSNIYYWDKQISVHSPRGCSCISSIKIYEG